MAMANFEPNSGFNLPAGCFDVPDTSGSGDALCGFCCHCFEICDGWCVCLNDFDAAVEVRKFNIGGVPSPDVVLHWVSLNARPMTDSCANFAE